jgi:hypothetical protein
MSKQCNLCLKVFDLDCFYKQKQKSEVNDTVWEYSDSMCKTCRSKYSSDRRRKIKKEAIEYLGGQCIDCGIIDVPHIYDFHHLDIDKKDFSIGKQAKSFNSIKPELDKCVLLCANCHRKRHHK